MPIGCYVADYSGHAHRRRVFGRADDPGCHRPKTVLGYSSASAATCTVCRYPCNMQRCGVNNKGAGALALMPGWTGIDLSRFGQDERAENPKRH